MKTILFIEDNLEIRENVTELLEFYGYHVELAVNGREGLLAVNKKLPDLILCDIMMPELTGYDVLLELKKSVSTSCIPFIFISASTEKKEIQNGLDLGANAYIRKPFELEVLLNEIKRCLA